jgi:sulfite dehydrogenase (quinone) subunit SoeA
VNEDPASPQNGLLLRDEEGKPQVIDRNTGKLAPWDGMGVEPDLAATYRHKGVTHRPVLHHMAERYLSTDFAPENVATRTGIPAQRIRQLAAEIARTAFDEAISLPRPWTDFRGVRHEAMTGRPVSFHAMRGISAHSNGFQTARALHTLQILIGAVETPGGMRFKPPYPKPATAHPRPHCKVTPARRSMART